MIFGHYLIVEPWSTYFSTSQPHLTKVIAWVRLLGLSVTLYKRSLIAEIGEYVGRVIKIDYQTENGCRRRFTRMVVRLDLAKPLTSKIMINGHIQIVEYEALPTICFRCGKYCHVNDICPSLAPEQPSTPTVNLETTPNLNDPKNSNFGPWMKVECRLRRTASKQFQPVDKPIVQGSRFNLIFEMPDEDVHISKIDPDDTPAAPGRTEKTQPRHSVKIPKQRTSIPILIPEDSAPTAFPSNLNTRTSGDPSSNISPSLPPTSQLEPPDKASLATNIFDRDPTNNPNITVLFHRPSKFEHASHGLSKVDQSTPMAL
ncbi:hypothetical protein V6N12_073333 [Hibiscus sabdariffa]|uniref:DUF4283 domain-containing protein n=1 Tax=Hibiscus sabdariffa TaxID=183260 RepID=A0ABR2AP14_9ROSI